MLLRQLPHLLLQQLLLLRQHRAGLLPNVHLVPVLCRPLVHLPLQALRVRQHRYLPLLLLLLQLLQLLLQEGVARAQGLLLGVQLDAVLDVLLVPLLTHERPVRTVLLQRLQFSVQERHLLKELVFAFGRHRPIGAQLPLQFLNLHRQLPLRFHGLFLSLLELLLLLLVLLQATLHLRLQQGDLLKRLLLLRIALVLQLHDALLEAIVVG
mmetsp:Transcript_72381/g.121498  ORF Transcript_72381/g.121498 Transcript_72381/m.121498 type:complete len:210 (+) Transcript_72381:1971-2600(+)